MFIDKIKNKILSWLMFKKKYQNKDYWIDQRNSIIEGDNLYIGKDVYIGPNATILCGYCDVEICDKVVIGPGITIIENNHCFDKVGSYIIDSGLDNKPENKITIETDCWIGSNVTILAGVTIGRGSIIGACSCVTKSIPPYSIAVGIPARVIKKRFSPEKIVRHEAILNTKYN